MIDTPLGPPVPQHAVLVLPSDGRFDSRAYRIARTLIERGHTVTVLARLMSGTVPEEIHPLGYRIVRVPASTVDGLPFQRLVRLGRSAVRRQYAWRTRTRYRPPEEPLRPVVSPSPARVAVADGRPAPSAPRASFPRRWASGLIRRLAIPLTLRSHTRNARALAPAADLYHGMAYMGIPIALDLARRHRAKAVYDARDIYLDARNLARMRGPARWLLARGERGWAHRADRVMTVNEAYAGVMRDRWGVDPLVVMNCSYRFHPPEPRERRFHDVLGLAADRRVVLYHGGLFPHRGVEELLQAIPLVPDATLVLMGYGVLEPEIREWVAERGLAGCVRLLPAVPPDELLSWVAAADVVAMPIQPSTLNHRLTTPNKLFEAMAAGVPSVASDLPGMAAIVRTTGCGLLVDPQDPEAIAAAIREILDAPDEERAALRRRCLEAAHQTYNWENQVANLLAEYSRLTGRPW
ncbi:MAG: glycosyl transferase group 1 [Chloroflexi bacterium]|nr:glycosyl transferase group 1 [Chloroflexota bacterium]